MDTFMRAGTVAGAMVLVFNGRLSAVRQGAGHAGEPAARDLGRRRTLD